MPTPVERRGKLGGGGRGAKKTLFPFASLVSQFLFKALILFQKRIDILLFLEATGAGVG